MKIVKFFFDMMKSSRTYPVKLKNRMELENITFKELSESLIEAKYIFKVSDTLLKNILYDGREPTSGIKKSIEHAINNCLIRKNKL
jgi:hypothetical protein